MIDETTLAEPRPSEAQESREHSCDCPHSRRKKDYWNGMDTGDYICVDCGLAFSRDDSDFLEHSRSR